MKNLQQKFMRRAGIIGMICLLAVSITSCIKDNKDYVEPPYALLSVLNTSPGSPPVDFYLDQNRASAYSFGFGGGLDYVKAYPGKRKATFYTSGTLTAYRTDTITLTKDKFYSLFLANENGHQETLFLTDSIAKPAEGKASIRFINLSPNTPAVDLVVKDGAALVTNKAYKAYSPFMTIDAKAGYTLEIRQAGTTTVLATLPTVSLDNGSIYTVWLQGLSGVTDGRKLAGNIQKNVYYY